MSAVSPALWPPTEPRLGALCPGPAHPSCPSRSYGMRFIAKVLKDSLHEKFPDAGEDELLKVRALGGKGYGSRPVLT